MTESLDDFLSYSNRGEKTKYLSKWKEDGSIIVWLSRLIAPRRLWRHRLKRIAELKDKTTGATEKKIWSDNYVCLEPEDILKDQNLTNKLTGMRKRPPHTCPNCLFAEYIREQILTGKLDWLAPVLKYETDDEEVVVHAHGMFGYPKADKLSDAQKKQLKEAGIYGKDSWQEDMRAKLNWIFVCAEHNHPENGLQVAIEPALLGDKVRAVIKKAIEAAEVVTPGDGTAGDPFKNPYPFKFSYNDAEGIAFGDKYDATGLQGVKPSPEIEKLISEDPPTEAVENLRARPNLAQLRENLESHCLLKNVPWDRIFQPAYDLYKENGWPIGEVQKLQTNEDVILAGGANVQSEIAKPAEDVYQCDDCGHDMLASETKCKGCGRDYAPPPAPPTPVKKSRSQASTAPAAAPAATPPVTVEIDESFASPKAKGDEDDGIPF